MSLPLRSHRSLLLRHVIAYPLAGAACTAGLFILFVRPMLSLDAWLLDTMAVGCGGLGILAGGVLGFARRPVLATAPRSSGVSKRLAPALATGALLVIVALTASPSVLATAIAGVALLGAAWLAAARHRRPW